MQVRRVVVPLLNEVLDAPDSGQLQLEYVAVWDATSTDAPVVQRDAGRCEASVRLAEQVPGDAGKVGAHRRYSGVRVA